MKKMVCIILLMFAPFQLLHGEEPLLVPNTTSSSTKTTTAEKIGVLPYLVQMGNRLDFYFTLEDRMSTGYPRTYQVDFIPSGEITSIEELLKQLNHNFEGYKFVKSSRFPKVIHMIAKDLPEADNPLNKLVTVEYQGHLQFMTDQIGKQFQLQIRSPLGGPIGEPAGDVDTIVDIHIKEEMSVRNVLTSAVPLKGYKRIICRSILENYSGDSKHYYEVIFYGHHYDDENSREDAQ